MEITNVTIYPYKNAKKSNLKAFVSIELDECFAVTGIKVMDGKKGLFVSMPSREGDDEYYDVAFPVTKKFREELYDAILTAYEAEDDEDEKGSKKDKKNKKSKKDEDDDDD